MTSLVLACPFGPFFAVLQSSAGLAPGIEASHSPHNSVCRNRTNLVLPIKIALISLACVLLVGCGNGPGPIEKIASSSRASGVEEEKVPPQHEPPLEDSEQESKPEREQKTDDEPVQTESEPSAAQTLELPESRVRFEIPPDWKRVAPQNNIVEAEFELPRVEGDEFDGRLTLMASGGDPQETIANRRAEFNLEPGEPPRQEKIEVAGVEATLVDLRGEWKGMSFRPMPSRAGYRMLLVIVPLPKQAPLYIKLTAPRATLAAREADFLAFLRSARHTP